MSVLPMNSSLLERLIEGTGSHRLDGLSIPSGNLWNPEACLPEALPWLAWALSVDTWDPGWSETQKRQVLKRSPAIHRTKGTRGAVESALSALGFGVEVVEWWEKIPQATPGTFDLVVQVPAGYAVNAATYDEITAITIQAKNGRSHLGNILLTPEGLSQLTLFSSAIASGVVTTLYPLGRIGSGDDVR